MELGAKGKKEFLRIMRLAGIPEGEKDIMVIQKGVATDAKRKVELGWVA